MGPIARVNVRAASNGQRGREGGPPASPFKAERAQRAQDGARGAHRTESAGRSRRRAHKAQGGGRREPHEGAFKAERPKGAQGGRRGPRDRRPHTHDGHPPHLDRERHTPGGGHGGRGDRPNEERERGASAGRPPKNNSPNAREGYRSARKGALMGRGHGGRAPNGERREGPPKHSRPDYNGDYRKPIIASIIEKRAATSIA